MPKNHIGFWVLLPIVLSTQLGSGAFFIPTLMSEFGVVGLMSWLYTGMGAVILAIMFALLCSEIPQTGGPHVYIHRAFGHKVGIFSAWSYWVISWFSSSVLLFLISGAINQVFPLSGFESLLIEISVLLIVMYINLFGIKFSGIQSAIFTFLKLFPLVIVCIFGWFFIDFNHYFNTVDVSSFKDFVNYVKSSDNLLGANSYRNFTLASMATLWAFVGVESATTPAENVRNIKKTIMRALFIGEVLVVSVYLISCFVIYGILGQDALLTSTSPYIDVLRVIFSIDSGLLNMLLPLLIVPVCFSSLNTWTLVSGQIAFGAAKSGLLPKVFASTNKHDAPKIAVILSTLPLIPFLVIARNDAFAKKISQFVDFSCGLFFIIYLVSALAFIKIFRKQHLIIGLLSILFCSWIVFSIGIEVVLYSLLIPLTGIFVYRKVR